MIQLRIDELIKNKGIRFPYNWLRQKGVSHGMAHRLLASRYDKISLEHIDIICRGLNCTPNELFVWTPDKNKGPLAPEHQLHKIAPRAKTRILEKLKNMTEDEIKQWEEKLGSNALREYDHQLSFIGSLLVKTPTKGSGFFTPYSAFIFFKSF